MWLSTPKTIASPQTSPKEMEFKESLHSPLKRGMSDNALAGVEAPKDTRCALKYINLNFFERSEEESVIRFTQRMLGSNINPTMFF